MLSVSLPPERTASDDGMRPVNLRTDLAALADLIELVFAPTMDESGRAAIREMRYMSRMGVGLSLLSRLNDIALGISMGYIYIANNRLVGNVSIYPANWPSGPNEAWIIANVAVHPDFQGRGIAHLLMEASLNMVAERGAKHAILQVMRDNDRAIRIYERLGFVRERIWTTWWRGSFAGSPAPVAQDFFITRRRPQEWRAEYAFAQRVRPQERGGLGWLRPLNEHYFHRPFWRQMTDWFSMSGVERLVIRDEATDALRSVLWVQSGMSTMRTRLTLLSDPQDPAPAEALINNVARRFHRTALSLEHPADEESISDILRQHRFRPEHTFMHMRLDF